MKRVALIFFIAAMAAVTVAAQATSTAIEIDLQEQTAYLIRNGRAVFSAPISSGRIGHLTDVLAGKETDKVVNFGHQRLSVFGIADAEELAQDARVVALKRYRFWPAAGAMPCCSATQTTAVGPIPILSTPESR